MTARDGRETIWARDLSRLSRLFNFNIFFDKRFIMYLMTVYKYQIRLDIEKDASNWFEACNRVSYGVDWKTRISPEVYENIFEKSKEEAMDYLVSFLKNKYNIEKEQIAGYTNFINKEYNDKFQKACEKVVELLGRQLYRNDFTIFLTTFPRCPYDYVHGYIWAAIDESRVDPIKSFLHELLHFQFICYWGRNAESAVSLLNDNQFNYLKESLTVILDEGFYPIIKAPDKGYDIHREFREELHKDWVRHHDFDKLVDFGLKRLPDFIK